MSSLRDRLYNQEATPPANAWERISAALDESNLADKFPSKLYHQEVTPPAQAWSRISEELGNEGGTSRTPVVRMAPRFSNFLRYAAAAILIFLAGYFILEWSERSEDPGAPQELVATPDTITPRDPSLTAKEQPEPSEEIIPNTPASGQQEIAMALEKKTPKRTQPRRTDRSFAAANYNTEPDIERMYAYSEPAPNLAERYVMLMTPTGKIIRMSRKWGDMVCCVSGEEQDADCKDQLRQWQEKLATTAATPSGNFMDVMSLVSALENGL